MARAAPLFRCLNHSLTLVKIARAKIKFFVFQGCGLGQCVRPVSGQYFCKCYTEAQKDSAGSCVPSNEGKRRIRIIQDNFLFMNNSL